MSVDLIKKIKEWLECGSYEEGVKLYNQCDGRYINLYRRFSSSKTNWSERNLRKELERLLALQKPVIPISILIEPPEKENKGDKPLREIGRKSIEVESKQQKETDEAGFVLVKQKPYAIVEIERLRNACYRERNYLHGQLEHYETNEKRYNAAMRMIDLDRQIKLYWKELDLFRDSGVVPSLPDDTNLKKEIISKVQRKANVRAAISQRKAWVKKEKKKEKPRAAKIDDWTNQQDQLEKELKELSDYLSID